MIGTLVLFSILSYAISNHLVYAHGPFHVYDGIRALAEKMHPQLGELFSCMICMPTWVGMLLSVFNSFFFPNTPLTPFNLEAFSAMPWWIIMVLDGFLASGIVWLIHTFQEHFEGDE